MRLLVDKSFPPGSTGRLFASMLLHTPLSFIWSFAASLVGTYKLTGKIFPVQCIVFPGIQLRITRHASASTQIRGRLIFRPHSNMIGCTSLSLGANSLFTLGGDFEIGQGVSLSVASGGALKIAGKCMSTGSGITSDTIVIVEKSLSIGDDVIIAWGCTITDSNLHELEGVERCSPVVIGNRVWISHQVSILKGANIPSGCIVGARSIVGKADYPEKALIAGTPAIVRKEGVAWTR